MSCLLLAVAALLALAVPASIAPASLVGAYVVIALLTLVAIATAVVRGRRRDTPIAGRTNAIVVRVVVLAVIYAGVVTIIHVTTR